MCQNDHVWVHLYILEHTSASMWPTGRGLNLQGPVGLMGLKIVSNGASVAHVSMCCAAVLAREWVGSAHHVAHSIPVLFTQCLETGAAASILFY